MLYNIYHKIQLGGTDRNGKEVTTNLKTFNSLSIDNDIATLTDTMDILIPSKNVRLTPDSLSYTTTNGDVIYIRRGKTVTAEFTFYKNKTDLQKQKDEDTIDKTFKGFVVGFKAVSDNIQIMCEDYMYLFKKVKIKDSWEKDLTLPELIDYIIEANGLGYLILPENRIVDNVFLGKFRIQHYIPASKVLEILKDKWKIFTYFKTDKETGQPVLYSGLKYKVGSDFDNTHPFVYDFDDISKNVRYPIIKNNLEYNLFDKETELVVVGTSTDENNKSFTIATVNGLDIITDEDKVKTALERKLRKTITIPNQTLDYMSQLILNTWDNYEGTSFKGTFTTFGRPYVQQGDSVDLHISDGVSEYIDERYLIDKVITRITPNDGFQQTVTVGAKQKIT